MIKYIFFVILLLLCNNTLCIAEKKDQEYSENNPSGSPVTANAAVDKATATIGERIRYRVWADVPEETEIIFPEIKEELRDFGVLESGTESFNREKGRVMQEKWFILETFNTGSYIIPSIGIHYKRKGARETEEVKTPEIFIEITSTLDKDSADIRDIAPPVFLKTNYRRLFIVLSTIFTIFTLAGITLFLFLRKKKKPSRQVTPPLSAHEIAYIELEKLQASELASRGLIKEYYYHLSDIVRHYLENRFELMAPERTTEEFLTEMTTTNKLEEMHKELIRNFLEHSDLVKFAEYAPQKEEVANTYRSARKLVDETKELLEKALS